MPGPARPDSTYAASVGSRWARSSTHARKARSADSGPSMASAPRAAGAPTWPDRSARALATAACAPTARAFEIVSQMWATI